MQASFVIPAHNEEAHVVACVAAIHRACQPLSFEYEVVVVADACSDLTAALARSAGARVVEVEYRHIAATRNAGAAATQGQWLFFVDADTQVTPAAVAAACASLRGGTAGGGGLFRFDRPVPFYGLVLERLFQAICIVGNLSGGCFLHCQRETFQRIGGFDTTLYAGEELAFAYAVKRHGRFRVVRPPVLTSARKLRLYSASEILRLLWTILLKGRRSLQDRSELSLWYRRRTDDGVSEGAPI